MELGPHELSNNTLLSVDDIADTEGALLCSTDRNESNSTNHGAWFLPNGLRINLTANDSQTLYLEHQVIELNRVNNSTLPTGVYHCEVMDKENAIHSLFVGIYPETEGSYDIIANVICTHKYHRYNIYNIAFIQDTSPTLQLGMIPDPKLSSVLHMVDQQLMSFGPRTIKTSVWHPMKAFMNTQRSS